MIDFDCPGREQIANYMFKCFERSLEIHTREKLTVESPALDYRVSLGYCGSRVRDRYKDSTEELIEVFPRPDVTELADNEDAPSVDLRPFINAPQTSAEPFIKLETPPVNALKRAVMNYLIGADTSVLNLCNDNLSLLLRKANHDAFDKTRSTIVEVFDLIATKEEDIKAKKWLP